MSWRSFMFHRNTLWHITHCTIGVSLTWQKKRLQQQNRNTLKKTTYSLQHSFFLMSMEFIKLFHCIFHLTTIASNFHLTGKIKPIFCFSTTLSSRIQLLPQLQMDYHELLCITGPQRMTPNNFGDPWSFYLAGENLVTPYCTSWFYFKPVHRGWRL